MSGPNRREQNLRVTTVEMAKRLDMAIPALVARILAVAILKGSQNENPRLPAPPDVSGFTITTNAENASNPVPDMGKATPDVSGFTSGTSAGNAATSDPDTARYNLGMSLPSYLPTAWS
jgi:hypothetical protein